MRVLPSVPHVVGCPCGGRSGKQAARQSEVLEAGVRRASCVERVHSEIRTGLDDVVKASSTNGRPMAVSPSSRNWGFESRGQVVTGGDGLDRLARHRLSPGSGVQGQHRQKNASSSRVGARPPGPHALTASIRTERSTRARVRSRWEE